MKVSLYRYGVGVASSRRIAQRHHEDIAYRVLAANTTPGFRTISNQGGFVVQHRNSRFEFFVSVGGVVVGCRRFVHVRHRDGHGDGVIHRGVGVAVGALAVVDRGRERVGRLGLVVQRRAKRHGDLAAPMDLDVGSAIARKGVGEGVGSDGVVVGRGLADVGVFRRVFVDRPGASSPSSKVGWELTTGAACTGLEDIAGTDLPVPWVSS